MPRRPGTTGGAQQGLGSPAGRRVDRTAMQADPGLRGLSQPRPMAARAATMRCLGSFKAGLDHHPAPTSSTWRGAKAAHLARAQRLRDALSTASRRSSSAPVSGLITRSPKPRQSGIARLKANRLLIDLAAHRARRLRDCGRSRNHRRGSVAPCSRSPAARRLPKRTRRTGGSHGAHYGASTHAVLAADVFI